MKYLKYFITPALAPVVMVGILLGGHWMWLGLIVLFAIVIGGDILLGDDVSRSEYSHPWLIELPLHLALPFVISMLMSLSWASGNGMQDFLGIGQLLGGVFSYDFLAARNASIWSDYLGAVLGAGFMVAGYATNVGHELIHRVKDRIAMLAGRWLLSTSCNADFAIEHVYGHHVNVCTDDDPATAKRGENVYSFFIRSAVYGHLSAWKYEIKRLRKKGHSLYSIHNRMITGYLMSAFWCLLFFIPGGVFGLVLFLGQALVAKFILEIVNYMEHYGLTRKSGQPVGPEHSWNTNSTMSTMVLFSLTRHSSHHEKPRVKFWKLNPYANAPEMPQGYLTTLLICLIPPLWYRTINPKLNEWEKKYAA
ncbi:MAG TPA: alkane 1-monooxygenase [Flavobacteriales bacterium]|nr:alkane 1-monooxygenase [Flavobacteriales bacterium]HIN40196.1 alkane 1-monooxygenase [Flavobacteriales bacterium]